MLKNNIAISGRSLVQVGAFVVGVASVFICGGTANAQSLTVLPVSITLPPGQLATTMTVINQGAAQTSVQVRVLSWNQPAGVDELTAADSVLISPPIITLAPGAVQTVRVVLRKPEMGKEGTYRILLDQIPPVAAPGTVRIALRLSIPVFAEPADRAVAHMAFHVEKNGGQASLVALNDGNSHETVRDIALRTSTGSIVSLVADGAPYILAGATRHWRITPQGAALIKSGTPLHITGSSTTGVIDQQIPVTASTAFLSSTRP